MGETSVTSGRKTVLWIASLVLVALIALVGIWFLHRFYAKATLDTALVRTGFGGQRVVTDGGCLALPILHQMQKVSMGALNFEIARQGREAVLTRDKMRADVTFGFELRVSPAPEGIAVAAQALGHRIARGGDSVHEVLSGALVNAIQNAAAYRSLDEIHLDRGGFAQDVATAIEVQAKQLGLMLVSSALISVDQSDQSQLNENNAFNAQGLRRLAELVADQRKERVRIETEAETAVRESRLAQHQRQLELQRAEREAEIAQQEHLSKLEADAKSREIQAQESAKLASETARIENENRVRASQVEQDEILRKSEMAAILSLEEAKIANEIQLAHRRAEAAEAKAAQEQARALVLLAAEQVQAQKDRAVAERERDIALIRQGKELELEEARVKRDVDTLLAKAQAETTAAAAAAEAEKARMQAEAAGRVALNSAENTLSDAVIRMRLEEHKLDRLPEIMTQMMKPVEKIDSIKINQISGAGMGSGAGGAEGVDGAFGAAMDQILGMAVRLPAMKQMGEEIGLDFDANLAGRTADYANRIKPKPE